MILLDIAVTVLVLILAFFHRHALLDTLSNGDRGLRMALVTSNSLLAVFLIATHIYLLAGLFLVYSGLLVVTGAISFSRQSRLQ